MRVGRAFWGLFIINAILGIGFLGLIVWLVIAAIQWLSRN